MSVAALSLKADYVIAMGSIDRTDLQFGELLRWARNDEVLQDLKRILIK